MDDDESNRESCPRKLRHRGLTLRETRSDTTLAQQNAVSRALTALPRGSQNPSKDICVDCCISRLAW